MGSSDEPTYRSLRLAEVPPGDLQGLLARTVRGLSRVGKPAGRKRSDCRTLPLIVKIPSLDGICGNLAGESPR
jgi:hypothetical protein